MFSCIPHISLENAKAQNVDQTTAGTGEKGIKNFEEIEIDATQIPDQ